MQQFTSGKQTSEMAKLKRDIAERFAAIYHQNTVLRSTVQEAKKFGFQDEEITHILKDQLKNGQEMGALKQQIYDEMFAYNIVHIRECWYAFYWVTPKGNKRLSVEPLLPEGVKALTRDLKIQQPLTHKEFMELRPQVVDLNSLNSWNQVLRAERDRCLHHYLNIATAIGEDNVAMIVTAHVFRRWKERILENSEPFNKNDIKERERLYPQIVHAFLEARKVYQIDDSEFYLSKERLICFVIRRNIIVTVFVKDFGFTSEINKAITLRQLKHIKHLAAELKKTKPKQQKLIASIDADVDILENHIKKLQEELNTLLIQKQKLGVEKTILEKNIQKDQATLEAEEKKLFKTWVPVVEEDIGPNYIDQAEDDE